MRNVKFDQWPDDTFLAKSLYQNQNSVLKKRVI